MKEPWFRGDPEIEVHIQGPYMGNAPTYAEDLSCSGEHPYDWRKAFDQNDGFWSGRVLLFAEEEVQAFIQKFSDGFHVMFWEDDNQPCTLKLDANPLADFVRSAATSFGTVALKLLPGAQWRLVAGAFVAMMFSNPGSWLTTNDDFLGVAVDQAAAMSIRITRTSSSATARCSTGGRTLSTTTNGVEPCNVFLLPASSW